jgi:hypothetical protein
MTQQTATLHLVCWWPYHTTRLGHATGRTASQPLLQLAPVPDPQIPNSRSPGSRFGRESGRESPIRRKSGIGGSPIPDSARNGNRGPDGSGLPASASALAVWHLALAQRRALALTPVASALGPRKRPRATAGLHSEPESLSAAPQRVSQRPPAASSPPLRAPWPAPLGHEPSCQRRR